MSGEKKMLGFVKKCFCDGTKGARNLNIEAAKKYLEKYLCELKLHFGLNDSDIQKLLITTYRLNKPQNPFVKYLSMIKYWN